MNRFRRMAFLLVCIVGSAVLLNLVASIVTLLEIFLIALGVLCIVWSIAALDDQIHLHKVKQQHREIALWHRKRLSPHSHERAYINRIDEYR